MKFNRQKMKFYGFPVYGEDLEPEKREKIAGHALVLMFRKYRVKWVQPMGVYATSGPASSFMLQKLVIRALADLQTLNGAVCNVTCNGHQTKKGVHSLFGITGKMENVT
jgi:hypothetical protein